MDVLIEDGNPFAIPDLWKTSSLGRFNEGSASDPKILASEALDYENIFEQKQTLYSHLPDLSTFTFGPLEDLAALDTSSASSSAESVGVPETLEEDIWAFPSLAKEEHNFRSKGWERFYNEDFQEPRAVLISEGGPRAFDAALAAQPRSSRDGNANYKCGRMVQSNPMLTSLLQLGLGRESLLFGFSEENSSFYPLIEDGRVSGYSLFAIESLTSTFITYGNKTRLLRDFIQKLQASTGAPASLVAVASSVSDLLVRLHAQLGDPSKQARSLLQLQCQFERPGLILASLSEVILEIQDASTDEEIFTRLYRYVQGTENSVSWLRQTLVRILTAASRPWLASLNGWLGFKTHLGANSQDGCRPPGFINAIEGSRKVGDRGEVKEYEYEFERSLMPSFITDEDASMIFETGRSLRLLAAHQPKHPLTESFAIKDHEPFELRLVYSWEDIQRIQAQAKSFELTLQTAIKNFDSQGTKIASRRLIRENGTQGQTEPSSSLSEDVAKAYIDASIAAIEKPFPEPPVAEEYMLSNPNFKNIDDSQETFAPPMSLVPLLSFSPLVTAQARLTNRACLGLLFKQYDLRSHLALLHRYSLFGDGVFASRLSHALFDPEFETAERRKGHSRAGRSGLKLGSRSTWPPASSELRLALMGILTDSYNQSDSSPSMFRNDLPGGLSFSIREMSEKELESCMDPDSIEALDFLKLEYKSPSPVNAVITSTSLLKYDAVFRLLLRALRMLFVVNQLFKDTRVKSMGYGNVVDPLTQRFRVESHHFISAICSYWFDGIQANWSKILARLEYTEKTLDQDNIDTLPSLREFHESVLDQILFALILRKRQVQVMKLLEEIFGVVLQFAKYTRSEHADHGEAKGTFNPRDLSTMYEKFQKKVRVFINVCRGLKERRRPVGVTTTQDTSRELARDGKADGDGGNTICQLLLKLEFSGYYSI